MRLQEGARLGTYVVLGPLGAGGMGEVYRARDSRLGREVALKVLPSSVAGDPERRTRFEREAKTLAALNHPHIAQIFGIEDIGSTPGLVMELVEGQTLGELIDSHARPTQCGIPVREALELAKQMAAALSAAHEIGIIHRDLKPANVKVREDGTLKVLDFGLAKLHAADASGDGNADVMNSPTITSPATQAGIILGTAAYMSPEQAKGRAVDRRADVWAFGAVLYEMLTGKRAFAGEDVTDTLAFVITRDPDWSVLPADLPRSIRTLLRRCLEKDRSRRLSDLGDARLEIEDALSAPALEAPVAVAARPSRVWIAALVLTTAAAAAGIGLWAARRFSTPAPAPVVRYSFALPQGQRLINAARWIGISPDGHHVVVAAAGGLLRRSSGSFEVILIPGSEKIESPFYPTFSPDGSTIAFWSPLDQTLRTIALAGGPTAIIGRGWFSGMAWTPEGLLIARRGSIVLLDPRTGDSRLLLATRDEEVALHPQLLDANTLLFTVLTGQPQDASSKRSIVVQRLPDGPRKTILNAGEDAVFVPSGHLVYAVEGILFATRFDKDRLEAIGKAEPVVEGVRTVGNVVPSAQFAISPTGVLAYLPGPVTSAGALLDVVVVDATGKMQTVKGPPGPYETPRSSSDGELVAIGSDNGKEANIWIVDLSGATSMRRLTYGGRNRFPEWTADGERIAYQSDREGDLGLFWQRADGLGAPERLTRADPSSSHRAEAWTRDGRQLLYTIFKGRSFQLHILNLADRNSAPFGGVTSATPIGAVVSPDGRWVAYAVTEADQGSSVVFAQAFPPTGERHQISRDDDGHHPVWTRDGRHLVYIPGPQRLVQVGVTTSPKLTFASRSPLPPAGLMGPPLVVRAYDVLPNSRFVGLYPAGATPASIATPSVHVVHNWFAELAAKVGGD